MDGNALVVQSLTKRYKDFVLDGVSFAVPRGAIVGLIGENGAGKSTTLNAILGLIAKDGGSIEILGKQAGQMDDALWNQIGVVFDGNNFPDVLTAKKLNLILRKLYHTWTKAASFLC